MSNREPTARERVLTEVFAAYNTIPAGNPSWFESQAAVGKVLDAVARAQQILLHPPLPDDIFAAVGDYALTCDDQTTYLWREDEDGGWNYIGGFANDAMPAMSDLFREATMAGLSRL